MQTIRHTPTTDALVRVPKDIHAQVKAAAALERLSLRELLIRLLSEYLSTRKAA